MDDHIKSFQTTSTNVLREITALAQQFDGHGRTLTAAASVLDRSNIQIKETLDQRRESLNALVTDLGAKTELLGTALGAKTEELSAAVGARTRELAATIGATTEELSTKLGVTTDELSATLGARTDALTADFGAKTDALDQRLRRFASLLADSFEAAEGRARDIARIIAEASTEGSHAIAAQYDLVRETTEEERQRTSEALRGIYEQATGETLSLLRAAGERFAEVVRDLKAMSADVQRELESTRGELRNGILELPQETAESAAQMRRVIVDQIEALSELNRIVARHGRGVDANDVRRAEPMVAAGGGRADSSVRSRRPMPPPRGSAPPRRPEPRPAPAPALTDGRSSGEGRSGGWLGDLLSRASRDDSPPAPARADARPPRQGAQTLRSTRSPATSPA